MGSERKNGEVGRRRLGCEEVVFSVKIRKKTLCKLCVPNWRCVDMRLALMRSVVCIVLLLVCLVSCGNRESNPETLDSMTEEPVLPDVLILLDASGSMCDSDPEGLGMKATRRVVERIARDSALSSATRMGILSFGDSVKVMAQLDKPSIVIDSISGIKLSLSGSTNLLAALRSGHQAFAAAGTFSGHKPVMLFITDGKPYDSRMLKEPGGYFLELQSFIEEKLEPRGCGIYVVGIDAGDGWNEVESRWRSIAHGVYGMKGMDQFGTILDSLIEQIYGIPPVPREVVRPGHDLSFIVPPYTEKLEVYILNGVDDGHLALRRPDDSVVLDDERDVSIKDYGSYRRLSILEPAHGKYRIQATQGEFVVYRKAYPYRLKLVKPADGIHPLGKPLQVEAAFVKDDGEPVMELPDYRLRFTGKVTTPDGRICEIEFNSSGDGTYVARTAMVPYIEGIYKVTLAARGGYAFRSEIVETITVELIPYAVITSPTSSSLRPGDLKVAVTILQAGEPLQRQDVWDSSILASLESPSGGILTAWLGHKPDSDTAVFHRTLPEALRETGEYRLRVEATDINAGADSVGFHVSRTLPDRASRWAVHAGIGLVCLLPTLILVCAIRARRLPRVVGNVTAYLSPDEGIPLGQRRLFRKRWALMHIRRLNGAAGRWIIIAGAPGGDGAIDIRYRVGLFLVKRRLYQNDALRLKRHILRYAY